MQWQQSGFYIWLGINWEVFDCKNECKARHMYEIISYSSHWCLEESWDMEYYIWDQAQAIKYKVQVEFIVDVQSLT